MYVEISELLGKTLIDIIGMSNDSDEITFRCSDGSIFRMFHNQECCESVQVEDVCGDVEDLIGSPILQAEESTNINKTPGGVTPPEYPESYTWTFYKLATNKGYVTIRWLGESNGYYSEDVSIKKVNPTN